MARDYHPSSVEKLTAPCLNGLRYCVYVEDERGITARNFWETPEEAKYDFDECCKSKEAGESVFMLFVLNQG